MKIIVSRYESTANGTLSNVTLSDPSSDTPIETYFGIECPWKDNQPSISCIPGGDYDLVPHLSDKYGDSWAFVGGTVSHYYDDGQSERYACLIHPANYARQLQGCLAIGIGAGVNNGVPAVWNSRKALKSLGDHLDRSVLHTVSIQWFPDE
jgi:hypothetical protein